MNQSETVDCSERVVQSKTTTSVSMKNQLSYAQAFKYDYGRDFVTSSMIDNINDMMYSDVMPAKSNNPTYGTLLFINYDLSQGRAFTACKARQRRQRHVLMALGTCT